MVHDLKIMVHDLKMMVLDLKIDNLPFTGQFEQRDQCTQQGAPLCTRGVPCAFSCH